MVMVMVMLFEQLIHVTVLKYAYGRQRQLRPRARIYKEYIAVRNLAVRQWKFRHIVMRIHGQEQLLRRTCFHHKHLSAGQHYVSVHLPRHALTIIATYF